MPDDGEVIGSVTVVIDATTVDLGSVSYTHLVIGETDATDYYDSVLDMYGKKAYDTSYKSNKTTKSYKILNITGSPTSLYMKEFWGHDENLMYYRNHMYPYMREGWGSTADYVLLSDNDTIDLAMFSN